MTKQLFIKTYGCQMNIYDSQKMVDVLKPWGYTLTDNPEHADMLLVNTCNIREKAEEKLYSDLGRYAHIKAQRLEKGLNTAVAVAGCVAQAHGAEIIRRAPIVDIILGPQALHRLPEMVMRVERTQGAAFKQPAIDVDFPVESKFDSLPVETSVNRVSAFLTIQEGCDKFCTFCCVPYTRGAEFSRPVEDIIHEARTLVQSGTQEITLLGQNVNAYHGLDAQGGVVTLGALIHQLADIQGLARIRYMTSHPCDVDDHLIAAHSKIPQLMPLLHLPVQSGSDRILKLMNRKHTAEEYRRIIARFREACPQMVFSSDFIVGFPEETEEDFQATLALVDDIGYVQAYAFKYSPRPGTPASLMNFVPDDVQSERLKRLQERVTYHQYIFNQSCVGKDFPVLFEKTGRQSGQLIGKTPYGQAVVVDGPLSWVTTIQSVHVTEAHPQVLKGVVL